MSAWRTTSEGAFWVGRISFAGWLVVAGAKAGLAEARTDVVGVLMTDEGVPFEAASFRTMAGVTCVGAESLGRLRWREEPSIKWVPNLPGREAGLLVNAERSSAMSWVSRPDHWCCVGRHLVERCRSGLPTKSLESRCPRTLCGWH